MLLNILKLMSNFEFTPPGRGSTLTHVLGKADRPVSANSRNFSI